MVLLTVLCTEIVHMFIRNEEKKSMGDKRTEQYTFKSYVRGFHVYQEIWTPVIGESLECRHKPRNVEDKNAIAVTRHTGPEIQHVSQSFKCSQKHLRI